MMAKIPKVTVTFDADLDSLKKGVKSATTEVDSFSDRVSDFGKKAALAFAAAGAAIGAFAIASVKAAAEDETGQRKLEETIRNTTSATAAQIAGIDKYVTAQSIATATTDDVIRPALSRLLRATGDLTKAQELLTLSQEISVATGKPLEAVTNAIGKAFEGSNTSLSKLGIGIDAATLKTLTFDETQKLLNKTFDGFIENQSTTAAFKFQQISIAVNESKEAIGAALLPVVKELADFILISVVPAIDAFILGLTGQDGLSDGLTDSQQKAVEFGKKVRSVIDTVVDLKDELLIVAGVIATIFVANKIAAGVTATIALIKQITAAYVAVRNTALAAAIASRFAVNPFLGLATAAGIAAAIYAATKIFDGQDSMDAPSTGSIPLASGFGPGASSKGGGTTGGGTTGGGTTGGGTTGGANPIVIDPSIAAASKKAQEASAKLNEVLNRASGIVSNELNAGSFDSGLSGTQSLAAINAISNRPFAFGTSGVNTNTLAGIMAASAQPSVTINVNAPSIIDEEGFTRAMNNAQNNSFFRGTGGATNLVGI